MNSIASNEKFKTNLNLTFCFIILLVIMEEMINENLVDEKERLIINYKLRFSLIKIFNLKSIYITFILVIYLLLTIISVSKIVKLNEGPLRKFNYE